MAHSGISGFCSPPALWHSSPRTSFLISLLAHVAALQFSFFPTLPHSEFCRERTKQYTIDQKDAVSLHAQKVKSLAMMDPNQVECVRLSKERLCHTKKKNLWKQEVSDSLVDLRTTVTPTPFSLPSTQDGKARRCFAAGGAGGRPVQGPCSGS